MSTKANSWILVIEDDLTLLEAVVDSLGQFGYDAIGVTDFTQAVSKLANQKFGCIILDLDLGQESKDGEALLRSLKTSLSCALNKETPVLLCSGNIEIDLIKRYSGEIAGALTKPYKIESLFSKLDACLAGTSTMAKSRVTS